MDPVPRPLAWAGQTVGPLVLRGNNWILFPGRWPGLDKLQAFGPVRFDGYDFKCRWPGLTNGQAFGAAPFAGCDFPGRWRRWPGLGKLQSFGPVRFDGYEFPVR